MIDYLCKSATQVKSCNVIVYLSSQVLKLLSSRDWYANVAITLLVQNDFCTFLYTHSFN